MRRALAEIGARGLPLPTPQPTPLHYKRTTPRFTWPFFKFANAQSGRATIILLVLILGLIGGLVFNAVANGVTLTRQQAVLSALFSLSILLVVFMVGFGRQYLKKSRLEAIASSSSFSTMEAKMRQSQVRRRGGRAPAALGEEPSEKTDSPVRTLLH